MELPARSSNDDSVEHNSSSMVFMDAFLFLYFSTVLRSIHTSNQEEIL